jgi:hypothetical protein
MIRTQSLRELLAPTLMMRHFASYGEAAWASAPRRGPRLLNEHRAQGKHHKSARLEKRDEGSARSPFWRLAFQTKAELSLTIPIARL